MKPTMSDNVWLGSFDSIEKVLKTKRKLMRGSVMYLSSYEPRNWISRVTVHWVSSLNRIESIGNGWPNIFTLGFTHIMHARRKKEENKKTVSCTFCRKASMLDRYTLFSSFPRKTPLHNIHLHFRYERTY